MASRRSVLAAGVGGLLAASPGCVGSAGVLGGSPSDPRLQDVTLWNTDDQGHVVTLRLDRDGERVLDRTYELGPRNVEAGGPDHVVGIDGARASGRGEFTAEVRVRDGDHARLRLDDSADPETPYRYEIRILDGGDVSAWVAELEATTEPETTA